MVTSVALGLVISFEPHELEVMQRPPRVVDRPILDGFGVWRIIFVGLSLLALTLWAFFRAKDQGASDDLARPVAVNALVIGQVFSMPGCRYKLDSSLSLRAHPATVPAAGHRRGRDLGASLHLRPRSRRHPRRRPCRWAVAAAFVGVCCSSCRGGREARPPDARPLVTRSSGAGPGELRTGRPEEMSAPARVPSWRGIAGLTAARDLAVDGYDVAILEARERTGGRI
jgi:hypothetical protein